MARTKGTRRLPPHSHYAATTRTTAQVQARTPPTSCQYMDAFDYRDEPTILAYLQLAPSIEHDMAQTDAFVQAHGRLPPSRDTSTVSDDGGDPYEWFWPFRSSRLMKPVSVFEFAVRHRFVETLAWLFCEQQDRLATTLAYMFKDILVLAASLGELHVVEQLLAPPVYQETLGTESRQSVLDAALRLAKSEEMHGLLLAHGANKVEWREVTMASRSANRLHIAAIKNDHEALEKGLRAAVVVDPSVLVTAVERVNAEAVEALLVRGFVDVEARASDGLSVLMVSAFKTSKHDWLERARMRRRIVAGLLDADADTRARDPQGHTALHIAIQSQNLAFVEQVLDHEIATSGVNTVHDDTMALTLAFEQRERDGEFSRRILTALLERGACTNAQKELTEAGHTCAVCNERGRLHRDLKRKRERNDA